MNVFAVNAANVPPGGPAGLIATIRVAYDDGTSGTFITDTTWNTLVATPPAGFEQPQFDDSAWPAVVNEGRYGVSPWGNTVVPPV